MIEEILGSQMAEDIFFSSMLTGLMNEKQACDFADGIEKDALSFADVKKFLGGLGGAVALGGKGAGNLVSGGFKSLLWLAALGAGSGYLGAKALGAIKDRLSDEDPESDLNDEMREIYRLRTKELEDSKWMADARRRRDDLRRGSKKMDPKDYERKYRELVDVLNERVS